MPAAHHVFHLKHILLEFWVTGMGSLLVCDPCFHFGPNVTL